MTAHTAKGDEMNHTPGPWHIGQYQRELDEYGEDALVTGIYSSAEGVKVAKMEVWAGEEYRKESDANAAFVVTACNAHEALVAMVKEFIQDYQEMGIGDKQTVQNAQQLLTAIEKGA